MKKEFSRILGVGLTVALLASLILVAAPASAGTLSWSAFTPVPSTTNEVLAPGSNILDFGMDADGDTIYAGGGGATLYKSTDGGVGWSTIDFGTKSSGNVTDLVAVAPDDGDIVAVADTTQQVVWVSTDGGTTWGSLSTPGEGGVDATDIRDIAMSAESAGKHYIAVGGIGTGPAANMWYYDIGAAAPVWKHTKDLGGFGTGGIVVGAVEFSPNFPSDQVLAVVSTNSTAVQLELFDFNRKKWNAEAVFDGYPASIVTTTGNITDLTSASIALGPDYLGSDDAMRMSFIGLTVAGAGTEPDLSGIHRMDDTTHKALKDGSTVDVHSIAYNGSIVVAGRYGTNTSVWYCLDPLATSPSVKGTSTLKRPGGTGKVVVAWMGEDVVAATSGDESAFAISRNDAKAFNDISLIDTTTANLTDVVVSADGLVTYMATSNATDASTRGSVWSYSSSWERVLSSHEKGNFLIRVAPDDPEVVYVAVYGGKTMYYSGDAGQARWQTRTSRYDVQDLAVEGDGDVAYVLDGDDGKVSKSTNGGFTWGTSKSSKLASGYMIASLGEDKLLVASQNGYVSYSTDGHDSFTKIGKAAGGNELVAIASGLATDDYIYVGTQDTDLTDRYVYRWQLGVSTAWDKITEEGFIPASGTAYGIALEDGVLYVSTANTTDSATLRTLNPTHDVMPTWSTMTSSALFDLAPQGLKVGAGSKKLWSIDSENEVLYSYTDTLMDTGPVLVSPKHGSDIAVNPVTGYAMDVAFTWEKPSAKVTSYQLKIALDEGFDETVKTVTYASTSSTVSSPVGKDTDYPYSFMPGTTYYWRVRVNEPVYSPYSIVYSLTVAEAEKPYPEITVEPAPAPPAPEVTVTPPEVTVEIPPIEIPPAAPAIPAYLLWTIIGIGAVLIIALIVLIVRTRRVV